MIRILGYQLITVTIIFLIPYFFPFAFSGRLPRGLFSLIPPFFSLKFGIGISFLYIFCYFLRGRGGIRSFSRVISILVSNNRVLIFPRQFFSASLGRRMASSVPWASSVFEFSLYSGPYFGN